MYNIGENSGAVEIQLIFSNPSSIDITVEVITNEINATGESTIHVHTHMHTRTHVHTHTHTHKTCTLKHTHIYTYKIQTCTLTHLHIRHSQHTHILKHTICICRDVSCLTKHPLLIFHRKC